MIYDENDMLIWEFHAYTSSRGFTHIKDYDNICFIDHNSISFGLTNVGSVYFTNMYDVTDKMLASLLYIVDKKRDMPKNLNLSITLDTGELLNIFIEGGFVL